MINWLINLIRSVVSGFIFFIAGILAVIIYFIYPYIAQIIEYFFWVVVFLLFFANIVNGKNCK